MIFSINSAVEKLIFQHSKAYALLCFFVIKLNIAEIRIDNAKKIIYN